MTLPESSDDDLHVSPPPPGWNPAVTGTGTLDDPFHSVQTAIRAAQGGRTVRLAEGQYIEEVKLDKVSGTETNRIRVQPYPGALASIDCLETRFLNPTTGGAWEKIDEGAPDEYRWTVPFPEADAQQVRHGAFLETPFLSPPRHTRLVAYDQAEDFRSLNELFPKDAATGDNNLWEKRPDPAHPGTMKWTHTGFRNWVYLGPGLWFDDDDRRLHLRLSLTHHQVDGWPAYTGPTDPAQVTLALSRDVRAAAQGLPVDRVQQSEGAVRWSRHHQVAGLHPRLVRPRQRHGWWQGGQAGRRNVGEEREHPVHQRRDRWWVAALVLP